MVTDLAFLSGQEAGALLARREIAPLDLLEANLRQIRRLDGTLHAFIAVDEDAARAEARRVGDEIARGGWRGGVQGLTLAVKDVIDVAGYRTTYASAAHADDPPAVRDADVVDRLRRAGAVILGKTNTPPHAAYLNTTSCYAGTTLSPWDLGASSGGSSGGSAVAVATGMCVMALGTDLGGSVRGPAVWNGCFGIRPTPGRVINHPHGWVDDTMDMTGVIARSPADVLAWLQAAQAWIPADEPPARPPRRIAWTADFDGTLTLAGAVRSGFAGVVARLRSAGLDLVERSPAVEEAVAAIRPLRALRALASLPDPDSPVLRAENPLLAQFLDRARSLELRDVVAAARDRTRAWRANDRFFDDVDLLILPATQFVGMRADEQQPAAIDGKPVEDVLSACYATYLITILGWPVVAVPCGLTEAGMPFGIQLVGPRGSESRLIGAASFLEREMNWRALRPPLVGKVPHAG